MVKKEEIKRIKSFEKPKEVLLLHPQSRQALYHYDAIETPVFAGESDQKINLKKDSKTFGSNKKFTTFAPATATKFFNKLKTHKTP